MAKNLAFFADGTWNGPGADDDDGDGVPDVTNVLKLYANLQGTPTLATMRLANEQERVHYDEDGRLVQHAKYMHGVGDSSNRLVRLMGGAFGAGVIQRIVRGYTFLSRNYEPGDRIYLVGFSRGAYTARALAGLVSTVGLLDAARLGLGDDPQGKDRAYRYGLHAWGEYRVRCGKSPGMFESWALAEAADPGDDAFLPAPIESVAVWDTVGSMGIPTYNDWGGRRDVFEFTNCSLSTNVKRGFHAVSLDERRRDFVPTLWDPREDGSISQVWFSGAHADVGGGYPKCGLADIALDWMNARLGEAGLLLARHGPYHCQPDPFCAIHEPWNEGVFARLPQVVRELPAGAPLHSSVRERVARDDAYRQLLAARSLADLDPMRFVG